MSQIIYEPFKHLPLSDFHDELRFEFPDLPAQLFDYYLVKIARRMASDGNLIRRRLVLQATQGVTRYRLESPDGMDICGILDIRTSPTCSCLQTAVARSFAPPEGAHSCGREVAWYDSQDNVLHIRPPFCSGTYHITLAVTPSRDACELPEQFLNDHLQTLLLGVKGSILLISGQPWTNLALGQAYYNEFEKSIPAEAVDVMTHGMRGGVRMNFGRVL